MQAGQRLSRGQALLVAIASLSLGGAGCTPDTIKQKLLIGAACMTSSDCSDSPIFYCDTTAPGGYCKKDCLSDPDCPPEAICTFTDTVGQCRVTTSCAAPTCRPGFTCVRASTSAKLHASHDFCDVGVGPTPTVDMAMPVMDMAKADAGGGQGG